MLFHVRAAEYLTDFKPKRVVLGLDTYNLLTPLRFFMLCLNLKRSCKYSGGKLKTRGKELSLDFLAKSNI